MFETPLLFYSSLCPHCNTLLRSLQNFPEIESIITKVNIDVNPHTKKRHELFYNIPKMINKPITEVPTLIVDKYFLVGTDVVSWLKTVISKQAPKNKEARPKKEDLEAFNPNEMLSFSDGYSSFGNTDNDTDVKKQSYHFISSVQNGITTIPEDEFVDTREQDTRETFDNMTRRQHQQSFAGNASPNVQQYDGNGVTRQQIQQDKKMSFDSLLEQKMLERQAF